ncbi:MAG: hypothetical protein ACR2GZ_02245 [Solirubrobacteraceae bacterium]
MAGYAVTTCGVDTGSAAVVVRRLSDGARQFAHAAADAAGPEGYIRLSGLRVSWQHDSGRQSARLS